MILTHFCPPTFFLQFLINFSRILSYNPKSGKKWWFLWIMLIFVTMTTDHVFPIGRYVYNFWYFFKKVIPIKLRATKDQLISFNLWSLNQNPVFTFSKKSKFSSAANFMVAMSINWDFFDFLAKNDERITKPEAIYDI